MGTKFGNKNIASIFKGSTPISNVYLGSTEVYSSVNLGPGPTELIAGDLNTAGFFGKTTQAQFGRTMTEIMSDLGITQGTAQNTGDDLLKFVHNGKIKYINQRTIRYSISWNHIQDRLVANGGNVYGGAVVTFGGNSYRVRLMRGWGQVSANTDGTGTPNYETGPLMTISSSGTSLGVNWPTNTSPWNAESPNEWNTLIFPISSSTQTQTASVPDWASYSNTDLNIASGNGRTTWTQETKADAPGRRIFRGYSDISSIGHEYPSSASSVLALRFVFELI